MGFRPHAIEQIAQQSQLYAQGKRKPRPCRTLGEADTGRPDEAKSDAPDGNRIRGQTQLDEAAGDFLGPTCVAGGDGAAVVCAHQLSP